jgi:hypothetical protein
MTNNRDIEKIFDAFFEHSSAVHKADAISKKILEIVSASEKRCGNCDLWMKRSCLPEEQDGQFKSMKSRGCKLFIQSIFSKGVEADRRHELANLRAAR